MKKEYTIGSGKEGNQILSYRLASPSDQYQSELISFSVVLTS